MANTVDEVVLNKEHGIHSLLKLHGIFVNSTVKWNFRLNEDYKARWSVVSQQYQPLLHNGTMLGFFLGDELLWNGMNFSELCEYAKVVRETFPAGQAVIYTNGAWPTLNPTMPGQKQTRGAIGAVPDSSLWRYVPAEIDWFSVDLYPDEYSMMGALNVVHSVVVPKLVSPDQKLVLVPPFYGTRLAAPKSGSHTTAQIPTREGSLDVEQVVLDCDDSDCDAAMTRWAALCRAWVGGQFRDHERIIAAMPYHWASLGNGTGTRAQGGKELPKARAAWEAIGREVVTTERLGKAQ